MTHQQIASEIKTSATNTRKEGNDMDRKIKQQSRELLKRNTWERKRERERWKKKTLGNTNNKANKKKLVPALADRLKMGIQPAE